MSFKSIQLLSSNDGVYRYRVSDTCFEIEATLDMVARWVPESTRQQIILIREYSKRRLPIIPSLRKALQDYVGVDGSGYWEKEVAANLAFKYPELEYEKLYRPCILRVNKQRRFGKAHRG